MPEFRIETERLVLREWREADRLVLKSIINTPAMMRYFGDLMTDEDYDAFFERRLDDQRTGGFCYWAVAMRQTGQLVGTCGLRKADDYPIDLPVSRMHEIGWRVGEAWWRQGFATEVAQASIDWLWRTTTVDVLAAWTTKINIPSQGVMKRLGMIRREDLDFDHHRVLDGSPLKRHVTYCLERDC
jgi:RimJ/RimL family protein N-acetyltransferase